VPKQNYNGVKNQGEERWTLLVVGGGECFLLSFFRNKNPGKTPKHRKLDPPTDQRTRGKRNGKGDDGKLELEALVQY
jgi:hypothetical protein